MIIDRYVIQNREELMLQNIMHEMLGDPNPYNKERYWKLIDNWKAYFANEYGLRKGDLVGIGLIKNNVNTTAILFALAELGCQVMACSLAWNRDAVIDYPGTVCKPALGLWDSIAVRMLENVQQDYFEDHVQCEMLQVDAVDIENYNERMEYQPPEVMPDDPFWITHADGQHEDGIEFQYYTHRECWRLAHREFKIHRYHGSLGLLTFNAVHNMSFIFSVIPTLMGCKETFFVNWWDRLIMWKPQMVAALQRIYQRPERKVVWVKNEETLAASLEGLDKENFDGSKVQFIMPFGSATPELHDLVNRTGIKLVLYYGETRSKSLTLFMKPIIGEYVKDSIGVIVDNYYECVYSAQRQTMFIRGYEDGVLYPLSFKLKKLENGEYAYAGSMHVHPFQKRVEEFLGHDDFFLLRKYGRSYLVVFEEPTEEQHKLLNTLGLTDIVVTDRMAFCLENSRYRDWFALKGALEYGYDEFDEGRVRYYNGEG